MNLQRDLDILLADFNGNNQFYKSTTRTLNFVLFNNSDLDFDKIDDFLYTLSKNIICMRTCIPISEVNSEHLARYIEHSLQRYYRSVDVRVLESSKKYEKIKIDCLEVFITVNKL